MFANASESQLLKMKNFYFEGYINQGILRLHKKLRSGYSGGCSPRTMTTWWYNII